MPSRNRLAFDRSRYPDAFLQVVDECHLEMINHQGRVGKFTNRENTVEMEYFLPTSGNGISSGLSEVQVILNLSHDKHKRLTAHHFTGEAAKHCQSLDVKESIDPIIKKYSHRTSKTTELTTNGVEAGTVISEIRASLEELNCAEVDWREINYGVKFTGVYDDVRFRFIVYFRKDEGLKGKRSKRDRVVWEIPHSAPPTLYRTVDQVIANKNATVDDLTLGMSAFHF
jgi:hypothetical protein